MLIFVIYVLAVWRISNLFVNESGPFDVFMKIRKLTGIVHDNQKRPVEIPNNVFAGVLSCVWCFSIWVAFFTVGFVIFVPVILFVLALPFILGSGTIHIVIFAFTLVLVSQIASLLFALPFALSAGAIWVNKIMEK